jgi:calcineurin-like phosphoesterase family protein
MTTFFTSDTHFGHANIIGYCKRPFVNVDEMNEALVARWNARVGPDDTVFHLGDFYMGPADGIAKWRARLQGRIVLIRGNHDRSRNAMLRAGFDEVFNVHGYVTSVGGETVDVMLRHHPPADDTWRHTTAFMRYFFCGHVHEAWASKGDVINVGVDVRGFEPKTFEELVALKELTRTTEELGLYDYEGSYKCSVHPDVYLPCRRCLYPEAT